MIDRHGIRTEIRHWLEELDGLGFGSSEASLLEDIRKGRTLTRITARGSATRTRRRPGQSIKDLSPEAKWCEAVMRHILAVERKYYQALIFRAGLPTVTDAAAAMKRNLYDYCRFLEGGYAIYSSARIEAA